HATSDAPVAEGRAGTISLRPERLTLSREKPAGESLQGALVDATYLGMDTQYHVKLSETLHLNVRHQNKDRADASIDPGEPVFISIADNAARFLVR
ncbi:MAG: TOBE domain-containing protein, partial [Pseudomonadota bacterium]